MVQPSSVDVRIDRFFRSSTTTSTPHIDPALDQPELTRLVEVEPDEPFILHPGEFVLGSTYETVTLPTTSLPGSRASRRSAAWAC